MNTPLTKEEKPGFREGDIKTIIEGVPYFSQSLDCLDASGNIDKYWFRRACGITCIKMIKDYYAGTSKKTIVEMAEEGRVAGGYSTSGWRHDYFVSLLNESGLEAHREEKMDFEEGVRSMALCIKNGGLVIASCTVPFMADTDFHMIVLKGVHWEDEAKETPLGFYYADPDSLYPEKASNKYVAKEVFKTYWRKMAIFVNDKKS